MLRHRVAVVGWPWLMLVCAAVVGCGGTVADPQARAAAEWALGRGGQVRLVDRGGWITAASQLPEGDFGLEAIDLNRPDPSPDPIRDKELTVLEGLKHLRVLGLYGANLTDKGLAPLLSVKSLQELELSQTRLTAAGLEQLAELPNLKKVFVRGTSGTLTDAGTEAFEKLRPGVTVYR